MYEDQLLTKYFYGTMKNPVFSYSLVKLWLNIVFYQVAPKRVSGL